MTLINNLPSPPLSCRISLKLKIPTHLARSSLRGPNIIGLIIMQYDIENIKDALA